MNGPTAVSNQATLSDQAETLRQQVAEALATQQPLQLRGGGSKDFYGRQPSGTPLDVSGHCGVVNYEPRELVLTARAGTPLTELQALLAEHGQMLAFEPPAFGAAATLGGTIACGLSGPRRPYSGAARDFVLGARIINGRAQLLQFGGEVMKNVAGYDVSRLMVGALGTLGLLLEVSLKLLPRPQQDITLVQERSHAQAIKLMNQWAGSPLPLSATSYDGLHLQLRLSGTDKAISAARQQLGGEPLADGSDYWQRLRQQQLSFFDSPVPLWRLSLPAQTPALEPPGNQLIDWGGAQRWLLSDAAPADIRRIASEHGGHATLFRGGDRSGEVFQPLPAPLLRLQRQLKQAFDPQTIFNPGRLYRDL